MLYTLYVAFVGAFVAIAATGHVLLLMAVYPNLSGTPATSADTRPSHHASPQAAPPTSKLAA